VLASASPSGVPVQYADPAAVDPEEAFVAAIASCHMLMFLFLAAGEGIDVHSDEDEAVGWMTPNEHGVLGEPRRARSTGDIRGRRASERRSGGRPPASRTCKRVNQMRAKRASDDRMASTTIR
jgi:organic hydroperoxide reductase OsmC/OhrA